MRKWRERWTRYRAVRRWVWGAHITNSDFDRVMLWVWAGGVVRG